MIRRILFVTAAATLLSAAPALAAEKAPAKAQACSCCTDGSSQDVDHAIREGQGKKAGAERKVESRGAFENADLWNGSFGG